MIKILFTAAILMLGFNGLAQLTDADYDAVAQDICDCMNKATEELSPEMKQIIIDSGGDEKKMEELMFVYASENPEVIMEDVELMEGSVDREMEGCFDKLESKYGDVESDETDDEVVQRLVGVLSAKEGCELSYAMIKFVMGLEEEEMPEEPFIPSDNPIYKELAQDACDCVNQSVSDLSPEMIQVIIQSEGDENKLESLMMAYATENPEQAIADAEKMQGPMVENIGACMDNLDPKYEEFDGDEMREDTDAQLLYALKQLDGCECSYVFLKMGMAE